VIDEHGLAAAEMLPAWQTWRRGVLGDVWGRFLDGRLAIVGDPAAPHGIRLVDQ